MDGIFHFPTAVKRDAAIDRWLEEPPEELRSIARKWFDLIRRCGDDVRELLHDGAPTACVHDASFAYVNVFKAHVNVGFFHGTALPDPARLLEGTGKRMRHVKLRPGVNVDSAALSALITGAYVDIRARLRASGAAL
jgi:hypothetical protein